MGSADIDSSATFFLKHSFRCDIARSTSIRLLELIHLELGLPAGPGIEYQPVPRIMLRERARSAHRLHNEWLADDIKAKKLVLMTKDRLMQRGR